jgi:hypothetical protein
VRLGVVRARGVADVHPHPVQHRAEQPPSAANRRQLGVSENGPPGPSSTICGLVMCTPM